MGGITAFAGMKGAIMGSTVARDYTNIPFPWEMDAIAEEPRGNIPEVGAFSTVFEAF